MQSKFAALVLGWLIPGAGHFYAGRKLKGFIFFSTITAAAGFGLVLGDYRNVYFQPDHYQFYAEVGNGFFTLVTSAIVRLMHVAPAEAVASAGVQAGVLPVADLYCMIAGLLNFIVAANAFDAVAAVARRQP